MTNIKLLKVINTEILGEMGFKEEHDGSGDIRGTDWNIRNENFHLWVDPYGEVKLVRVNPDTDPIIIQCETIFDLQCVIDFIVD